MKKALSLILAAGLALVGVPVGAQGFGPNTVWGVAPPSASTAVNARPPRRHGQDPGHGAGRGRQVRLPRRRRGPVHRGPPDRHGPGARPQPAGESSPAGPRRRPSSAATPRRWPAAVPRRRGGIGTTGVDPHRRGGGRHHHRHRHRHEQRRPTWRAPAAEPWPCRNRARRPRRRAHVFPEGVSSPHEPRDPRLRPGPSRPARRRRPGAAARGKGPGPRSPPALAGQADYQIGPSDILSVTVYGHPDLTQTLFVQPDGTFTFPLVGRVKGSDMTPAELEKKLVILLSRGFIRNPQVTVVVQEYRSKTVYVVGEVARPGPYPLVRPHDPRRGPRQGRPHHGRGSRGGGGAPAAGRRGRRPRAPHRGGRGRGSPAGQAAGRGHPRDDERPPGGGARQEPPPAAQRHRLRAPGPEGVRDRRGAETPAPTGGSPG